MNTVVMRNWSVSAGGCAGRGKESLLGLAHVHEPVHHSDHDGATDDVADGNRQQVGDEDVIPGQEGEICGGLANHLEELAISRSLDKQASRDELHVGNAVLETGGHEAGDGRDDCQDLVSCGAGGIAHPDGHADQGVTHNAQCHGLNEGQANLAIGNV